MQFGNAGHNTVPLMIRPTGGNTTRAIEGQSFRFPKPTALPSDDRHSEAMFS